MPTNTAPAPWVCATCGATTTDRGRRLMGPRCWLCSGTLYRDDEEPENPEGLHRCRACGEVLEDGPDRPRCPNGPHALADYEGGRR